MNGQRIPLVKLFFHGCYVRLQQAELINSQSTNLQHFYHSFWEAICAQNAVSPDNSKNRLPSSPEAAPMLSHGGYILLQNYPTPFPLVEITEFAKTTMTKNSITFRHIYSSIALKPSDRVLG